VLSAQEPTYQHHYAADKETGNTYQMSQVLLYDNGNKIKQADSEYEAAGKPKHNPSAFCPIY